MPIYYYRPLPKLSNFFLINESAIIVQNRSQRDNAFCFKREAMAGMYRIIEQYTVSAHNESNLSITIQKASIHNPISL